MLILPTRFRCPTLSGSPIRCPCQYSTMEPPRRARRSCWKLSRRTLISGQELSWGILQSFYPASMHPHIIGVHAHYFSVSGIWTWGSPSIRTPRLMGTLGAASFHGRSLRSWSFRIHPALPLVLSISRCSTVIFFLPSTPHTHPPAHVYICWLQEIEGFFKIMTDSSFSADV